MNASPKPDMTGTLVDLQERARASADEVLRVRLELANIKTLATARLVALHWLAIYALALMVREMLEPAKNTLWFPDSWASKLTAMWTYPWVVWAWFGLAIGLVVPLIAFLVSADEEKRKRFERPAVIGLFMGGAGYGVLSIAAARLDIAHVVASYRESAVALFLAGLLVACWHNSRMVMAERAARAAEGEGFRCECAEPQA